jgi:hypothetical protein
MVPTVFLKTSILYYGPFILSYNSLKITVWNHKYPFILGYIKTMQNPYQNSCETPYLQCTRSSFYHFCALLE